MITLPPSYRKSNLSQVGRDPRIVLIELNENVSVAEDHYDCRGQACCRSDSCVMSAPLPDASHGKEISIRFLCHCVVYYLYDVDEVQGAKEPATANQLSLCY